MAPPSRQPEQLRARIEGLVQELAELDVQSRERAASLPGLELEVRALGVDGSMAKLHEARAATSRPASTSWPRCAPGARA